MCQITRHGRCGAVRLFGLALRQAQGERWRAALRAALDSRFLGNDEIRPGRWAGWARPSWATMSGGCSPSRRMLAATETNSRKRGWACVGPGFEFRVELGANHEGMITHFRDLNEVELTIRAADDQAGVIKGGTVGVVEFKAVAVSLNDGLRISIGAGGVGAGGEVAEVGAETHGAALGAHALLVFHDVDDGVAGGDVELCGVGHRPGRRRFGRTQ